MGAHEAPLNNGEYIMIIKPCINCHKPARQTKKSGSYFYCTSPVCGCIFQPSDTGIICHYCLPSRPDRPFVIEGSEYSNNTTVQYDNEKKRDIWDGDLFCDAHGTRHVVGAGYLAPCDAQAIVMSQLKMRSI